MSRFFIYINGEYKETDTPPNHDHWTYDWKNDSYYEQTPDNINKDCSKEK